MYGERPMCRVKVFSKDYISGAANVKKPVLAAMNTISSKSFYIKGTVFALEKWIAALGE